MQRSRINLWRSVLVLATVGLLSGGSARRRQLDYDRATTVGEALARGVGALMRIDASTIMQVAPAGQDYVLSPWAAVASVPSPSPSPSPGLKTTITTNLESTYLPLAPELPGGRAWVGVVPFMRSTYLFLEGSESRVIAVDAMSGKFLSQHAIILDQLSPAKDSRGPPTQPETAALRRRFIRALGDMNENRVRLAGIAPLPLSWRGGEDAQFLVVTRIPGFLLATMRCSADTLSQCQLRRACFAEGLTDLWPESVSGLAISAARRQVLVGDRRAQKIHVLHFESCFHVPQVGELKLAKQFKELSHLFIDADDSLWLSTAAPDDFRNANIFRFDKESW